MVSGVQARGLQLVSHAMDNPRERWPVFAEARQAFVQGLALTDTMLNLQLAHGALPACPQAALMQSPSSDCWLHTTVCVVLQEISRAPTWRRASALCHLQRLPLWEHIFVFLAPPGTDVHNVVSLVVERAMEHGSMHHDLAHAAVSAHAWHLLSRARYDNQDISREEELKAGFFEALSVLSENQHALNIGTSRQREVPAEERREPTEDESSQEGAQESLLRRAREQLAALQALTAQRAAMCAEAGRAFTALRRARLAAEAFTEAAVVVSHVLRFKDRIEPAAQGAADEVQARQARVIWDALLREGPAAAAFAAGRMEAMGHALQAGRCWLLVAQFEGAGSEWGSRDSAESSLQAAGLHLRQAGGPAAAALGCVGRMSGTNVMGLLLLCATWLGCN